MLSNVFQKSILHVLSNVHFWVKSLTNVFVWVRCHMWNGEYERPDCHQETSGSDPFWSIAFGSQVTDY